MDPLPFASQTTSPFQGEVEKERAPTSPVCEPRRKRRCPKRPPVAPLPEAVSFCGSHFASGLFAVSGASAMNGSPIT